MSQINHYEHPLVVENYQFRCPYSPFLFKLIAKEFAMDTCTRAIDLCCGGGEVTQILSEHADQVWAVDQSELMLAKAPLKPNAKYLQGDINDFLFLEKLPKKYFDFIFVGRGIHWITLEGLSFIAKECSKPNGYFLTVQSGFRGSTDWLSIYHETINNLLSEKSLSVDWLGRQKCLDAGYEYLKDIFFPFQIKISLEFLVGQAMSYRVERAQKIKKNQSIFFAELQAALKPFMSDGMLLADVFSSASVYKKIS